MVVTPDAWRMRKHDAVASETISLRDDQYHRQSEVWSRPSPLPHLEPDAAAMEGQENAFLFEVVKRIEIPLRRLDTLIAAKEVPQPDILKIDTQGYELQIIKGLGEKLDQVIALEFECRFRPVYRNEATFFEIFEFLRKVGFRLTQIEADNPINGELYEVFVYFTRQPRTDVEAKKIAVWRAIHGLPIASRIQELLSREGGQINLG